MKQEREELRLVTNFSELKLWDIVVGKPCPNCGGAHRTALVHWVDDARVGGETEEGWEIDPEPSCRRGLPSLITAYSVASGLIYKVDNGLDVEQTQREGRVLEKLARESSLELQDMVDAGWVKEAKIP